MSIQLVISLLFTVVAVIGIVFIGASLFWRFSTTTEHLAQESSERVLTQVNLNLDSYLRRMMRISDTVYYRLIKNTDFGASDESRLLNGMNLLYEENMDALVSIALFDRKGDVLCAVPLPELKQSAEPTQRDWFLDAMGNMENMQFSTPHIQMLFEDPDYPYQWVVSLSRYVQLTRNGTAESGVLLVDTSYNGIAQVCQEVELYNGGYLYLVDGNGEIIYHPMQQLIYAGLSKENNALAAKYTDGSHEEFFEGEKRYVTVKTVGYTGWKLVGVTPAENLWTGSQQMLFFGISIVLFSAFLLAFLNFKLSAYLSEPIRRLERSIQELERGKDNIEIVEDGCYEVQQLSHSIRSMVSTMRHLMDDIIEQERQKRRNELEVLQSQINPHFLYNTLDSVIWLTEAGQSAEAVSMVTSLARLFRISLSKGKSIIPLKDELDHARHYMAIQEIRYRNKFKTSIIAHEGTENLCVIKLIVQPILENAIYHGMAAGDEDGEIRVEAYRQGDDLIIAVSDNGSGIPETVLASLLDENRPDIHTKGSGIGVKNVHRRIKLTYGSSYGLTFESEPDEGTTVYIRLPAVTPEQKESLEQEK